MAEPRSPEQPTPEQLQFASAMIAKYGERLFVRAREFSGLRLCMVALGTDDMSSTERAVAYHQASQHLDALLGTFMDREATAALIECAQCIDGALSVWMCDDIERRDGLPPAAGTLSGR